MDLWAKCKTQKSQEATLENLDDLGQVIHFLDITPKGQAVKERTEKLDFIKNCSAKENVKRLRR